MASNNNHKRHRSGSYGRHSRRDDDNNDDPAAAANDANVAAGAAAAAPEEESALSRLLHRLRREHAANFSNNNNVNNGVGSGGGSNNGAGFTLRPADIDRARYLLEATAGNVGLASWLYWEDYLSEQNNGSNNNNNGNNNNVGGNVGGVASGNADSNQSILMRAAQASGYDSKLDAYGASSLKSGELKRRHDDNDDEDNDSVNTEEGDRKPSISSNSGGQGNEWDMARRADNLNNNEEEPASPNHNQNPLLDAPPPPIPGRRRLPQQELMDLEAFLVEVGRIGRDAQLANHAGNQAVNNVAGVNAAGVNAQLPINLPINNALANIQQGYQAAQQYGPMLPPRISELFTRLIQGRPLDEEERRELAGALGMENLDGMGLDFNHGGNEDNVNAGEVNFAANPRAAAAGAGGDDDGDSDNSASQEPDNNNVPFDWNEPFENIGLVEAHHRRSRRKRRRRRFRGDGASISDDDDLFVPGPDPVFREIVKGKKRKKVDGAHLHGEHEEESVVSEGEEVDINQFFNAIDESVFPFEFLWAKDNEEEERTCILQNWLRTGFTLSECGNGLAMAMPGEDEVDAVNRMQPQIIREGAYKSLKSLFPYHCKGLSALLSLVTALLYSGASIRGNTVTCHADRKPWSELTLEQKRQEFPKRLIDALSSLIYIAAQSTSIRCANALATMNKQHATRRKKHSLSQEDEDEFTINRLKMQKRVHQCRVCSWEPDTANNDAAMMPRGRDFKDVRVHSSLTNIQDIKAYVRSHLRSFTEPGGCALFLETIARCHGTVYFNKVFEVEKKEPSEDKQPEDTKKTLVKCHCKETLQYLEKKSKDKTLPDSMPEEHDCIQVELISLLLTGQIYNSYDNWDADRLGIGLLRIQPNSTTGPRLLRPLKPVWLCHGDFGYSALFLDKADSITNASSLDEPGKAFQLAHWDCWGGALTTMKVIPSIHDHPSRDNCPSVISDMEEDSKRTVTTSIVTRMVQDQKRDCANLTNNGIYNSANNIAQPITNEELNSIQFHPEDEKFYPKEYKRWRYSVGAKKDDWISFFRLSGRQKLVVEMKLAPRICVLIRSRWPLATVRDFSEENAFPLV